MGRKRVPGLTAEDRALWNEIRRSITPLARSSLARTRAGDPPAPAVAESEADLTRQKRKLTQDPRPQSPSKSDSVAGPGERANVAPTGIDRKLWLRMKRGKLSPEARIDLHGMTLAEAHPALTRFLRDASDRGLRTVLVITGKGRPGNDMDPGAAPRGVLKHQVPHWLGSGPLKPIVQQVMEAHQRHGGGGAYYVRLRRRG